MEIRRGMAAGRDLILKNGFFTFVIVKMKFSNKNKVNAPKEARKMSLYSAELET